MRVTNAMMTQSIMWNISGNLNNMNKVYTQLASGEKYATPSESPLEAAKALEYQSYLTELQQYENNIEDADSWMRVTESAVESMVDIMQSVSELTIQANNDTLTDDDRGKIETEIEELTNELIQLCNTDYAGSYIFAGYDTNDAPFDWADKPGGQVITYKGDYLSPEGPFNSGQTDADILTWYAQNSDVTFVEHKIEYPTSSLQSTQVNINGYELMGTGMNNLTSSLELLDLYLQGETSYKMVDTSTSPVSVVEVEINMDDIIESINASVDGLVEKQTEIGARMNSNELKAERVASDIELYGNLLSSVKEADIAQLSVEMSEAETVYEASLAASSKIIMPTLLNFL